MSTAEPSRDPPRRALVVAWASAFFATCGLQSLHWWAHPSLFDDDFLRVASLQHSTLGAALFRPFNEHMAPLFEVISWLAWVGAGRQVLAVPLAFQVASFVAFAATAALVMAWVRIEVGSTTAAPLAFALFSLSAVAAEAVLWYSASSFQWAAAATLAACLAAALASRSPGVRGRIGWSVASGLASLSAPAFSAIGVLAGVAAAVRLASAGDRSTSLASRLGWAVVPLVGTAGYFAICDQFQYRDLVSASVRGHFDPAAATWATVRAPAAVLIPGLIGLPQQSRAIPGPVLAGLSSLGLLATLAWSARSRLRPFLFVCLTLIVGGYLSTYATRARPGDPWIFEIQRYHLLPQIGLVGLISAAASGPLRRFDRGRAGGYFAATCLAATLAAAQAHAMTSASARAFRFPDQPRALEAAVRLGQLCARDGITLAQAIAALEPIRTPWFPNPRPVNPLLNLLPPGPLNPRMADALVRPTLLAALSPEDVECLFGGMDATRFGVPAVEGAGAVEARIGAPAGQWGRSRHLEYRVGPEADDARSIALIGFPTGTPLEVWWAGDCEGWSPYRSVRWETPRGRGGHGLAVALASLPHWRAGEVRRVRVIASGHPRPLGPGRVVLDH